MYREVPKHAMTATFDKIFALSVVQTAGQEFGASLRNDTARSVVNVLRTARETIAASDLEKTVGELRDAFYIAGLIAYGVCDVVSAPECIKAANAGARTEEQKRILGNIKSRWSWYRDEAGYPKLRSGGRKSPDKDDAGEATTFVKTNDAPKVEEVPTFKAADDPRAFVKAIAARLTLVEKHNATLLQSCGVDFRTLCEAARRLADGEVVFLMSMDQLNARDEKRLAEMRAQARADVEAEIKAVAKAKRDARKAA